MRLLTLLSVEAFKHTHTQTHNLSISHMYIQNVESFVGLEKLLWLWLSNSLTMLRFAIGIMRYRLLFKTHRPHFQSNGRAHFHLDDSFYKHSQRFVYCMHRLKITTKLTLVFISFLFFSGERLMNIEMSYTHLYFIQTIFSMYSCPEKPKKKKEKKNESQRNFHLDLRHSCVCFFLFVCLFRRFVMYKTHLMQSIKNDPSISANAWEVLFFCKTHFQSNGFFASLLFFLFITIKY